MLVVDGDGERERDFEGVLGLVLDVGTKTGIDDVGEEVTEDEEGEVEVEEISKSKSSEE